MDRDRRGRHHAATPMTRTCIVTIALGVCAGTGATFGQAESDIRIQANPARGEIMVSVGPIDIPAATAYSHHPAEARMRFRWPSDGWLRGYRIDLVDAQGRTLPRALLHHAGVANLDRRQLPYPSVERLVAVGRETPPILLPDSMGIPLVAGQDLMMYYALVNPAAEPITNVTLRLTVAWTAPRANAPRNVFPLFLDANPGDADGIRAFDLPPGVSATSAEFRLPTGGRLRALGGHLHDYAVEIRLEDVVTGKVLARLKTKRHSDGRLISVDATKFLFTRGGLRLSPNHPYRVVGIYDNPTPAVITGGAMAFLAGPFIPDDVSKWPAVDSGNEQYQRDRAAILGAPAHAGHKHGGH